MSTTARFRRGNGRLSASLLSQMATSSELVARQGGAMQQAAQDHLRKPVRGDTILAKITAANEIEGVDNRWEYEWEEVEITGTGMGVMTDGLAWDDDDQRGAWNLCELMNDGSDVEGPGWDLATAPGTFNIQPIAECVVLMHSHIDTEGDQRWVFWAANVLDGECEEDEEEEP